MQEQLVTYVAQRDIKPGELIIDARVPVHMAAGSPINIAMVDGHARQVLVYSVPPEEDPAPPVT